MRNGLWNYSSRSASNYTLPQIIQLMAFNLQSKFQNLQRKHEATELDLMHTRLLAASVDAEYDEDDGEGEFIDQLRTGLEDLNQFDLKWYSGFKLARSNIENTI